MLNVMLIITDLLKKMGNFFFNLVPCECTLLSLSHCGQKEKCSILTNQSTYSCIFVFQEGSQPKARSEVTVLLQWEIKGDKLWLN